MDAEWEKLRFLKRPHPVKGDGAWDEGTVREASSVREEARQAGKTVHFGRIVELCHEEGSELADGDPEEKMQGRSVLLGDNIKDQDFSWAEFCELGSSPLLLKPPRPWTPWVPSLATPLKRVMPKALIPKAPLLGAETWATLPESR